MHCWQQRKNLGPFPDSLFSLSWNGWIASEPAIAILYVLPTTPAKYLVLRGAGLHGSCNFCGNLWKKSVKRGKDVFVLIRVTAELGLDLSPSLQCPVHSLKFFFLRLSPYLLMA